MRPPRLESCYFPTHEPEQWRRLAAVLEASARQHCPDWSVSVRCITPAPRVSAIRRESHARNTEKLDEWNRLVQEAPDGERILLIDTDTMVLRSLDDIWARDFDIAYTVREQVRLPFNAGVIFLRVSPAVRAFMQAWWRTNLELLADQRDTGGWKRQYGGINQGSLGFTLASPAAQAVRLLKLACAEWNCEDSSWPVFHQGRTRILHIKSGLRAAVFGQAPTRQDVRALMPIWTRMERALRRQEAHSA